MENQRSWIYGNLRNGADGFDSGAFGHHVAVCNARLAVQSRVAVAVLDTSLSLLEIAERKTSTGKMGFKAVENVQN